MSGHRVGRNIATAGLTAAGKTTHGRLLATALGYSYVSATDLFIKHLDLSVENRETVWFDSLDDIEAAREGDLVDKAVEAELIALAQSQTHTVFDTWALPWLSEAPMVSIWIESDMPSRTRKAYVSQLDARSDSLMTLVQCRDLIRRKDEATRDRFLRRHKFDLFTDRTPFDIVLDNSTLIPQPSVGASRDGIRQLTSVAFHCAMHVMHPTGSDSSVAHLDAVRLLDPDRKFHRVEIANEV